MSSEFNPWQLMEYYELFTEKTLADREPIAERWGATPWELSILEAIELKYGMVPREQLGDRCHGIYAQQFPIESRGGVDRCFQNGWVQVITPLLVQEMRTELELSGYIIPGGLFAQSTSDTEFIGVVYFTRQGLELYLEWSGYDPQLDQVWTCVREPGCIWSIYANSQEAVRKCLEGFQEQYDLMEEPRPIGRWCCGWWIRFQQGFVARVRTTEFD